MTYEEMIPDDMLPIADDPGGNVIVISLNKDDYGYVYFIRTDQAGESGYIYFNKKKYGNGSSGTITQIDAGEY